MKTYMFDDAVDQLVEGQTLQPTKPRLWERSAGLFTIDNNPGVIKYYEEMGGRWKIVNEEVSQQTISEAPQEFKKSASIQEDDIGPIYGITTEDYDIIRSIREYDPESYRRMRNWD